ncbi:hypothetical protein AMECASPLE_037566 [Ameca splendens]|uniref:CCHC-type domain-containing protein n=1 Tax=Ameca splendens TaxID=208324 RepID=A0ABV0YKA7_9TELE
MRERRRFPHERSAARTQLTYQSPTVLKTSSLDTGIEAEPMQIGRAHLSIEERQKRRQTRQCFYCGSAEHFIADCPSCPLWPKELVGRRGGTHGPKNVPVTLQILFIGLTTLASLYPELVRLN